MGYYATTTTLQILLPATTFDTATTSLGTQCIKWAEDEVNKYLSKRYDISSWQTSGADVPPMCRTLAEWLSCGYLWQQNARGSKESIKRGDIMIDRAIENLKMIADNKLDLLSTAGSSISESANPNIQVFCNTSDYTPTFNEDDPLNWSIDRDKLQDIADERD